MNVHLSGADWLALFTHYTSLSLLAVGGAIATAPDMHRYLVDEHGWLNDTQFTSSIAIAQAAPGPNVLFIALLGWNIGLNTGSLWAALAGVVVTMSGMLIPSGALTLVANRWGHRNRERRGVKAFKQGMAPIVVAMMFATGWLLTVVHHVPARDWHLWLLTAVCAVLVWRTQLHLLWLLSAGALLGAFGLV